MHLTVNRSDPNKSHSDTRISCPHFYHTEKLQNETPSSVIFLGVEGVLYSRPFDGSLEKRAAKSYPQEKLYFSDAQIQSVAMEIFDRTAIENLEKLLKCEPQAQIVLTSEWRRLKTIEQIQSLFAKYNFAKKIVDKTPDWLDRDFASQIHPEFMLTKRAAEIKNWLEQHPDVTNYVVINQAPRLKEDAECAEAFVPLNKVVLIDRKKTLSRDDYLKAMQILDKVEGPSKLMGSLVLGTKS